jgi:hypothetical protein
VSDQRAADGRGDERLKKRRRITTRASIYPNSEPFPESAENWHRRAMAFVPLVSTFRSLRLTNSQSNETLLTEWSGGWGKRSGGGAGRVGSGVRPVFWSTVLARWPKVWTRGWRF